MADLTDVADALESILSALIVVDEHSTHSYQPLLKTGRMALLIVPFEQRGAMQYGTTGMYNITHAHVMVCEFWRKVNIGDVESALEDGRNVCLQALRLIAANPTLNGTVLQVGSSLLGEQGMLGRYDILPRYEDRGQITYIIARLFVPVEIREVGAW